MSTFNSGEPWIPQSNPSATGAATLDLGPQLNFSWAAFSRYAGAFIGVTLIVCAVPMVISLVGLAATAGAVLAAASPRGGLQVGSFFAGSAVILLFMAVIAFVGTFLSMGLYRAALDAVKGESVTVARAFRMDDAGPFLAVQLLLVVALFLVGSILGMIPVIGTVLVIAVLLAVLVIDIYASMAVLDRREGAISAIQLAWAMLIARPLGTLVVAAIAIAMSFAGAMLLSVGLIVAMPVGLLMVACEYRRDLPAVAR